MVTLSLRSLTYIERFQSGGQHLCKFIGTKESVCIRKEFNFRRIGLGHQHGRRFIVSGHQAIMTAVTSSENTLKDTSLLTNTVFVDIQICYE